MASCDSTSSGGVDAEDAWSVHQSMLEHQPEQELAAASPRGRRRVEAPGRRRQGCWGGTHCAALTAALLVAAAVLLPQAPSQSVSREGRGSVVSLTANAASGGVDPDVPVPTANMKMDMLVAKVLALRSKLEDLHRQVVGLETGLRACAGAPGTSPIVCATVDDVCCNGLCCGPDAICCGPPGAQICCSHGSRCCSEVALCLDSNTSCPASTAPTSDWPKLPMSAGGSGVATAPEIEFKTEPLLNGTSSGNDSSNATAAAQLPSADDAIESLPTPSSEAEPALDNGSKEESDTASEDAPAAAPPLAVGDVQEMLRVAPPEAATALSSASGDDGTSSSTRDAKVQEAASPLDSATGGDGTSSSTTREAVQESQASATKEAAAALDGTADGDAFSATTTASERPQSQPPATTEATPVPDSTTSGGAETHESQAPLTEEVAALPDSTTSGDGTSSSTTAPETHESQASPTKEAAPAPASTTSGNGTSSSTTAPETHERQASPTKAAPALGGLGAADGRGAAPPRSSTTSGASQPPVPPPALGEEEMLRAAASEAAPALGGLGAADSRGAASRSSTPSGASQPPVPPPALGEEAETPHEDEGTLGSGISSTTTAGVQPDVGGVHVIQVGPSEAEVRKEKAMADAVPRKASTNREEEAPRLRVKHTTVTGSKHDAMEQVM